MKRETLKLISGWVSRSNDPQMVSRRVLFLLSLVRSAMEVFKHVFIFKSMFIMAFILSSGPHKASSVFNSATTQ